MILTYHEIMPDQSSYRYGVTRGQLEEHFRLVKEVGPADGSVQVTFDDGHVSHHRYALPLLEKFGIRGVFCVTAGWTGMQPEYMNVTQLKELVSLGHQVQAHGWSHKMLTECSPSELHDELWHSKQVLEDRLGIPIEALSIPHGRWNDRVLEACASAGYKEVYVSEHGIGSVERSGVRLIGRLMVTRGMSSRTIAALLKTDGKSIDRYRIKDWVKNTLRTVLGDKLYHQLWRAAADPAGTVRLEGSGDTVHDHTSPIASNRPATILQLISSGGYYGAESMLINLAQSLDASNCHNILGVFRNSQDPHVEVAERAKEHGLHVEVIPCDGRMDWAAVREIRKAIYKYGVDIIHTHGSKANFYGALAGAPLNVPLVATYHLDWPDRGFLLYCYHLSDRLTLRLFRKVLAVSDAIARSLRRSGLNPKKVAMIANGIDVTPFTRQPAATQDVEAGKAKNTIIGVVGRLTPQKGHQYLLQAAPGILSAFPNVTFLFVGDGQERHNLQQMASSLGIGESVVFAGQRSDMPAVYASIDILVLPSINEGMPMTLIEAMAARRPVIATDVGDVAKLIRHGETGLLVEAANPAALQSAIVQLLSDPAQCSQLALQGKSWVCENFSADGMARQYREVYGELLRQGVPQSQLQSGVN